MQLQQRPCGLRGGIKSERMYFLIMLGILMAYGDSKCRKQPDFAKATSHIFMLYHEAEDNRLSLEKDYY